VWKREGQVDRSEELPVGVHEGWLEVGGGGGDGKGCGEVLLAIEFSGVPAAQAVGLMELQGEKGRLEVL